MNIPRGLTARIAGFHPAGPGSTPGVGIKSFFSRNHLCKIKKLKNKWSAYEKVFNNPCTII